MMIFFVSLCAQDKHSQNVTQVNEFAYRRVWCEYMRFDQFRLDNFFHFCGQSMW